VRSSRWLPIAGWCLATATSIVLSSVALSPVLNAARTEAGALPDLDQLPPAEVAVTTTTTEPPARAPEVPAPGTATAEPTTEPTSEPTSVAPSRTTRKPTSKPPATTKAPTTPPAAVTTPPTTTEDGWTVTTGDGGLKTYVKSFTTPGGRAVIRMISDGTVALVTATPADGFTVQKVGSDTNLAVYFNETGRSFIVHAQWWNDTPLVEVSQVGG
jgi:hypothetical protein